MGCSSSLSLPKKGVTVLLKEKRKVIKDCPSESDNLEVFPDEEKQILKRHWRVLSNDIQRLGTTVFHEIFKEYPDVKQIFSFRDVDNDKLLSSAEFRGHGYRFMQAVGAVIENIDNLETTMAGALIFLGKQHVTFRGIKPIYFESFFDVISNVWKDVLGKSYTTESAKAWRHVFLYIMEMIKKGFNIALREGVTSCE